MRLTGTYALTAAVNPGQRRITGMVVPFGEEGGPGLGGEGVRLVVEAGGLSWDDTAMPILRSSHHAEPIGRAVTLDAGPDGIVGNFKVVPTSAGDDALVLAAEQLQAGLSIEAEAPDGFTPDADGIYRLTAANPARLSAVALVERPAFASAQVLEVAAAEIPDDTLTQVRDTLTQVVEALTPPDSPANDGGNQGDTPMSDTTTTAAEVVVTPQVTAAATPPVAPQQLAATAVTREPFPYGHPGASGRSFFADLVASRQDPDAGQRVRTAHELWLTAANEPITKANAAIIPNQYANNLFVDKVWQPRDIADRIPSTSISSAQPVLVPSVTSVYADGGSGEPVGSHSEGTNPAQGEVVLAYKTYTPAPYSGMFDINREALDAASPGLDSILMGFLRESYAQTTEAAAVTSITGTASIDTGSAAHNATAATKAQLLEVEFRREIAQFKARLGQKCDVVFAAPDQYEQLAVYSASDGRPLLPYTNQVNSSGGLVDNGWEGQIFGVPIINAYRMTQYKDLFLNLSSVHRWESPLLQFRWDEVAGPAKIRFAAFGYFLVGVLNVNGVSLLTQAQS